jgi:hypothetical protein
MVSQAGVETCQAFADEASGGCERGDIGEGGAQDGRSIGAQVALYLVHADERGVEVEAWSDDVINAGDDTDQVGVCSTPRSPSSTSRVTQGRRCRRSRDGQG